MKNALDINLFKCNKSINATIIELKITNPNCAKFSFQMLNYLVKYLSIYKIIIPNPYLNTQAYV